MIVFKCILHANYAVNISQYLYVDPKADMCIVYFE
jgi:hypothetical protein